MQSACCVYKAVLQQHAILPPACVVCTQAVLHYLRSCFSPVIQNLEILPWVSEFSHSDKLADTLCYPWGTKNSRELREYVDAVTSIQTLAALRNPDSTLSPKAFWKSPHFMDSSTWTPWMLLLLQVCQVHNHPRGQISLPGQKLNHQAWQPLPVTGAGKDCCVHLLYVKIIISN